MMKKALHILLFALLALPVFGQTDTTVSLRMEYNSGTNKFDIYLRANKDYLTEEFTGWQFTVKWPTSSGYSLPSGSNTFSGSNFGWSTFFPNGARNVAGTIASGGYNYLIFSNTPTSLMFDSLTFGTFDCTLRNNTEVLVASINGPTGYSGDGSEFEIVNDAWTGSNGSYDGDFYIEINGVDVTGVIYRNPADIVWNGSAWNTTPGLLTQQDNAFIMAGGNATLPSPITKLHTITFEDGATLEVGAGDSLILSGGKQNISGYGHFIGDGFVVFRSDTLQEINKASFFTNVKFENANGIAISGGEQKVVGVLEPKLGVITTNGYLTMRATGTGDYGQIDRGAGSISGTVKVEHKIRQNLTGWRHLALPVNAVIGQMKNQGIDLNFSGNAATQNIWYWDASENGSTGQAKGWTMADSTSNNENGYDIYIDATNFPVDTTTNVQGAVYDVDKSYSIYNFENPNNTGNTIEKGWNFIPNPYACNYKISDYLSDPSWPLAYKAVHVWDPTDKGYKAILAGGVTTIDTAVNISFDALEPYQGFWVKMTDGSDAGITTFTMQEEFRDPYSTAYDSNKNGSTEQLKLVVSTVSNKKSVFTVYNSPVSIEDTMLTGTDAFSLRSEDPASPELFAFYPQRNGDSARVCIKGIPNTFNADTIPLGFKSTETGGFRIKFKNLNWTSVMRYHLYDRKLNKWHDFSSNAEYAFNYSPNDDVHRFDLAIASDGFEVDDQPANEFPYSINVSNGMVHLNLSNLENDKADIEVVNMAGQVIYQKKGVEGGSLFSFSFNATREMSMYVVRVKPSRSKESATKILFSSKS